MGSVRKWLAPALCAALMSLQGCGGGGGSSTPIAAPPGIAPAGPNVQPISVNTGLGGTVNLAFTSVTLCVPGSIVNCQTIDNIVVDTGSTGLRILSSVFFNSTLVLPPQVDVKKDPIAECAHFADGNAWGPVKLADLTIASEHASGLPIQVIGDPSFAAVPLACSSTGTGRLIDTVQALGGNGILGLNVFRRDCGDFCAQDVNNGIYYTCPTTVPITDCQSALTPLALQLQHPVSMFALNNNGVIIELPSVPAAGAVSVSGSLVFGIGTQPNNLLGAANVISVDPGTGFFITNFNGASYPESFIDSGSNALFFRDDGIDPCLITSAAFGFYCPASTFNGSATIPRANGASATVNFSIANAATLFAGNQDIAAFVNLGAPQIGNTSFDWGLPFFYGRNVYTAIEGAITPGGPTGPYVAFVSHPM